MMVTVALHFTGPLRIRCRNSHLYHCNELNNDPSVVSESIRWVYTSFMLELWSFKDPEENLCFDKPKFSTLCAILPYP